MNAISQGRYGLMGLIPEVPTSLRSGTLDANRPEEEFIKLMVAQLQNQDPEKPMDGTALISQVTQMNAAIAVQRMSYLTTENHAVSTAAALLGKQVLIRQPDNGATLTGRVQTVDYSGKNPLIVVDGQSFPLNAVLRVDV